jgi:hypothetical protein
MLGIEVITKLDVAHQAPQLRITFQWSGAATQLKLGGIG